MGGSLELARALTGAGVRTVVCTPHFSHRYPAGHREARERMGELADALARAGLELGLVLAAEISPAKAVEAPIEELWRRRLGERFLLVELEPDTPAGAMEVVIERLGQVGLKPVFAHPERCRAVRSQPHVIDAARVAGAPFQIVARSLAGGWGGEIERAAWSMLEAGRADLLASDSHRERHAGPALAQVLAEARRRLGEPAVRELTEENPARVIERGVLG
jgi:protein-tyrosine phosphatase